MPIQSAVPAYKPSRIKPDSRPHILVISVSPVSINLFVIDFEINPNLSLSNESHF